MMLKASKLIEGIKEFALGGRSGQTQPKGINPKILAIHSMLDAAKRQPKNNALESKVMKMDNKLESLQNEIRANERNNETKEKMLLEKFTKTNMPKPESGDLEKSIQSKMDTLIKSSEKTIEIIDNLSSRIDAVEAENTKKTKPALENSTQGKIDTLVRSSDETIKTMKALSSRIGIIEANAGNAISPVPADPDMENRLSKIDDELEYLKNELRANEKDGEEKEKMILEKLAKTGNIKAESGSFDKVQGRLDALVRSSDETIKTMKALSSRIDAMEAGKNNAESHQPIDSDIESRLTKMDDELEYLKNELRANEDSKPEMMLPKGMEGLEEKIQSRIDSLVSSGDKTLKIIEEISSRIDTLESEKAIRPNNNNDIEKRYGALAKDLSEIKKEMSGIEKNIESIRQANKDRDTVGPLEKSKRWIGLKTGAGQDDDTAITLKRLEEIRKSINT